MIGKVVNEDQRHPIGFPWTTLARPHIREAIEVFEVRILRVAKRLVAGHR